jgi:glycosyltransferase involved in cell wall biosynthesis
MRRLLHRVRSLDPDVVHVQWLPFPVLDVAWLRKLAREWPTILTAHDIFPPRNRSLLGSWTRALLMVDAIVVHSHRGADALAQCGVDDRRLEVVAHPVFPPEVPTQTIDRDESIILFFGLIRRRKNLDVLLRALPSIVEAVPTARLVVAGDPMEPMRRLRRLAVTLGVALRIEWRLVYLPTDEIAEVMRQSSVVVLPYSRAGSSGVLATSLGYGRPVVVSDVGSLSETVREFGAGRVVPPGDARAVGLACVELLADREA